MSSIHCKKPQPQHPEESIPWKLDFTGLLETAELLTGTPTATISPSGPTLGVPAVNVATFINEDGETVAIGKGVVIRVSGVSAPKDYKLTVTADTTVTPNRFTAVATIKGVK